MYKCLIKQVEHVDSTLTVGIKSQMKMCFFPHMSWLWIMVYRNKNDARLPQYFSMFVFSLLHSLAKTLWGFAYSFFYPMWKTSHTIKLFFSWTFRFMHLIRNSLRVYSQIKPQNFLPFMVFSSADWKNPQAELWSNSFPSLNVFRTFSMIIKIRF